MEESFELTGAAFPIEGARLEADGMQNSKPF
jgi:hypothetical protein